MIFFALIPATAVLLMVAVLIGVAIDRRRELRALPPDPPVHVRRVPRSGIGGAHDSPSGCVSPVPEVDDGGRYV